MGSFEVANATWRWERNLIQHHLPRLWPIAGRCDLLLTKGLVVAPSRKGSSSGPASGFWSYQVFPATSRKVPKYTYIRSKKVTQFRFLPFPSCSILFRLEDQAQGFSLALQIHKLHYLEMWAPPCFGTPTQRHLRSLRQTGGSAPDFTSRRSNQRTAKRLLGTEIRAVWFMPWNWYTAKSQMCLKWTTNYIKPTRQFYVCFRPDWSHRLPKSGDIEKVATLTNVGLKSFSHTPGRCSNRPW